jgi:O-antigen/teichoic acid export membrane protein
VLLGPKWTDVKPLIQMLAITGVFQTLQSSSATALVATGHPGSVLAANTLYAAVLLVSLASFVPSHGSVGAALATTIAALAATPVFLVFLRRYVGIPFNRLASLAWRPMCAAIVMLVVVLWLLPSHTSDMSTISAAGYLAAGILESGATYLATLGVLWLLAGKPDGGEQILLSQFSAAIVRLQTRMAR